MRKILFYFVSVCILLLVGCASQDRRETRDTDVGPAVSEDAVKKFFGRRFCFKGGTGK